MKLLQTILISISLISSIILWITRAEWLPSLSAFALSDNVLWYRLMHLTGSWFFLLYALYNSKVVGIVTSFMMGMILVFDMYHHHTIHDIVTLLTLLLSITLILHDIKFKSFNFIWGSFLSLGILLVFIIGYFVESFHLLLAEIIAMFLVANAMLLKIYNKL